MLYKNGKLEEKKDKKLWEKFKDEFKSHLDSTKSRINPENPIIIKYVDSLTTPNKDNPTKPDFPRSISLSYTAIVTDETGTFEYRYSPTAGITQPNGTVKFTESSVDVMKTLLVLDIDLAFFFWGYSPQNAEAQMPTPGNSKYFIVANENRERNEFARKEKLSARINARLWMEEEEGGLTLASLKYIAEDMMIAGLPVLGSDALEDDKKNALRHAINAHIKADKTIKTRERFLEMSDKMTDADKKNAGVKATIQRALDSGIINENHKLKKFFRKGDDPTKDYIWDYAAYNGNPKIGLFEYLSNYKPELITWMKSELEPVAETV